MNLLIKEDIGFLRYLLIKKSHHEFPQRRAYLNMTKAQAEQLAMELGAEFISSNEPLSTERSPQAVVIFFNDGWHAHDWPSWQEVHLFVERPPRWGGPSLVIEVYPNADTFIQECPSRHHVDFITHVNNVTICNHFKGDESLCGN